MFKNRLREILLYFVEAKEMDTFETLADAVLQEQFLNKLPADVKQFSYLNSQEMRTSAVNMQI